jgi:hypothetical protein
LGFDPAWDRLITPKNPPCRFACHAAKCAKSFSGNHRVFPVEIRKSEGSENSLLCVRFGSWGLGAELAISRRDCRLNMSDFAG